MKLKADQEFVWGEEQQKALNDIKQYLVSPPVLIPPKKDKLFKLYLSVDERAIGSALIQEFEGKECVIYFISKRLMDAEAMYSPIERLCICLYFHAPSLYIIYRLNASLFANMTLLNICYPCRF